ncbi:MAG: hypothetical protein KGI50_04660 [Patescibacteria group bacterium]|nr:hypothetical protein [Patescibacteria group bacterium]MDE2438671.1 hypothetical protein [Patescibacteria group bacterium]
MQRISHYIVIQSGIVIGIGLAILPMYVYAFTIDHVSSRPTNSFTVLPAHLSVNLSSTDVASTSIFLVNQSNKTIDFSVSVRDTSGLAHSARNWIIPEITSFSLDPGQRIRFGIMVQPPASLLDGDYYASLLIAGTTRDETALHLISSLEVPVFIAANKGGTLITKGEITRFYVAPVLFSSPIHFEWSYRNKGNSYVRTGGVIVVHDVLRGAEEDIPINMFYVLSGDTKNIVTSYAPRVSFGIFTATLALFDEKPHSIIFVLVPWQETGIVLVFIVLWWVGNGMRKKSHMSVK